MRKKEYFVKFIGKIIMEELNIAQNENPSNQHEVEEIIDDNSQKSIEKIKNITVEQLYQLCEISKSMPISFDKIVKYFKIRIMGTDFNFISQSDSVKEQLKGKGLILGMVNISDDFANIYYNNNSEIDIPRQRFTIAHELAHCINHYELLSKEGRVEFLQGEETSFNDDSSYDEKMKEFVCNKFARDFLIPTDLLVKIINTLKKVSLEDLSELFMVPEKEMNIKLKELGYNYE